MCLALDFQTTFHRDIEEILKGNIQREAGFLKAIEAPDGQVRDELKTLVFDYDFSSSLGTDEACELIVPLFAEYLKERDSRKGFILAVDVSGLEREENVFYFPATGISECRVSGFKALGREA